MKTKVLGIIPARYESTRFPGKPLVKINGKPMIQLVYEAVKKCTLLDEVVVATDDIRIETCVQGFGGTVAMTKSDHPSGTDRCEEALGKMQTSYDVVVNIQGDEPFIKVEQIESVVNAFKQEEVEISTLAKKIDNLEDVLDPNVVKAVKTNTGKALYFSRSPIPFVRNHDKENWLENQTFYKHIGIYGYRSNTLKRITSLPPSSLEKSESLEQLRWLEQGIKIQIEETNHQSIGIDTPEDLKKISK